jgi:hypothetical protein
MFISLNIAFAFDGRLLKSLDTEILSLLLLLSFRGGDDDAFGDGGGGGKRPRNDKIRPFSLLGSFSFSDSTLVALETK